MFKKISVTELTPGMILAKPVRADDGKILLHADCELKTSYIEKIIQHNCDYVYIKQSKPERAKEYLQIKSPPQHLKPIKDETRTKAYAVLKKVFEQVETTGTFKPAETIKVVQEIVDHILKNPKIVYNMFNIQSYDDYTYSHSVNVCVLATLIGSIMGYNQNELEILGVGGMLHDIGKTVIEPSIINKPAKLDSNEFAIIQSHPIAGYNLLIQTDQTGFLPAYIALQHHEREDSSGYPKNLSKNHIHPFSKIVAVADVFDSMTSNRVYRNAVQPYLALQELKGKANIKYNLAVVENLMQIVTPYPIGTVLILLDGEEVEVINVSRTGITIKHSSGINKNYSHNNLPVVKEVSQ